ncbi:pseudouridine synthase [Lipomyces doorenjongii]|uniref:pseudouridine synthase n=1 Tax=Lipomyces doorenjongii TaxID=383834 RepID=UPI0034CD153F
MPIHAHKVRSIQILICTTRRPLLPHTARTSAQAHYKSSSPLERRKTTLTQFWQNQKKSSVRNGALEEDEIMPKEDYKFWTKKDLIERISELEALTGSGIEESRVALATTAAIRKKGREGKEFKFKEHPTRFIGLRFTYLGWNYNGLNVQAVPTPLPTVEGLILKALVTCKLIESETDLEACQFSRCGRTDKGVSALAQVISLRVRSRLTPEEQKDEANDERELSYITMLNNLLPLDIRVYQVCLHPPDNFDARFSCVARHYKYIFVSRNRDLDVDSMRTAAKMMLGAHDFRNFCKIDGSKQITNFNRCILHADITLVNHQFRGDGDDEVYMFDLKGTAFLWHQVRCIMGVLLLVGQGLEKPDIVEKLLDVKQYPCKPIYDMASDTPLVLYNCEFGDDVKWKGLSDFKSSAAGTAISSSRGVAYALWYDGLVKNELQFAMRNVIESAAEESRYDPNASRTKVQTGDGMGRWLSEYVPLQKRPVMDSFEVLNERWLQRKTKAVEAGSNGGGTDVEEEVRIAAEQT